MKESEFAPGSGTVIAGLITENHVETTQNQILTPILRPTRGTVYFWSTNLSVLLCFARMVICGKVEPLSHCRQRRRRKLYEDEAEDD